MASEEKQAKTAWRILKTGLKWLLFMLLFIVCLLVACIFFKVPLPLNVFIPLIENIAEESLGREVTVGGPLRLVIGPHPELSAGELAIANPDGYTQRNLLYVKSLQGQMDLFELTKGGIQIDNLAVSGVIINLEQQADRANWEFDLPAGREKGKPLRMLGIDEVSITNLNLGYLDQVAETELELDIQRLAGQSPLGQPLQIEGIGTFQNQDWTLTVESATLKQLLEPDSDLPIRLDAQFLGSTIHTELTIGRTASPVQVDGSIEIDRIDPDRFALIQPRSVDDNAIRELPGDGPAPPLDLATLLEPLGLLNANLDVRLGELAGLPVTLRDAEIGIHLQDSRLDIPLSLAVDDTPVSAEVSVSKGEDTVALEAKLEADTIDIGAVLSRHTDDQDVSGQAEAVSVTLSTRGRTVDELARAADLALSTGTIDLSFGNEGMTERVELDIDRMQAGVSPGQSISASASGQLKGQDFELVLNGPALRQLLEDESWHVGLQGNASGANLALEGDVSIPDGTSGPTIDLRISGDRFGDLSDWAGVQPDSGLAYDIRGNLAFTSNTWMLNLDSATLGETSLSGGLSREISDSPQPIRADLRFDVVNVGELDAAFAAGDEDNVAEAGSVGPEDAEPETRADRILGAPEEAMEDLGDVADDINLDLRTPLYPGGIDVPDIDFLLSISTLKLVNDEITNIELGGQSRDGTIEMADVGASLPGMELEGDLHFDPAHRPRTLDLRLSSDDADLGMLLSSFGIAEDVKFTAGEVDLEISLQGRRLGPMLEEATLSATVRDAQWLLEDPNEAGELAIEIHKGQLSMTPEEGIRLTQDATIRGIRTTLTMTARHPGTAKEQEEQALKIDFETPNFHVAFDGQLALPVSTSHLDLTMSMEGENLRHLNKLFALDLPPYGPFSAQSSFHLRPERYRFDDLIIKIGTSEVNGTMEVRTTEAVPRIVADLVAKEIQLADFRVEEDDEDEPIEQDESKVNEIDQDVGELEEGVDQVEGDAAGEKNTLLDGLQNVNADLTLSVEQVFSGKDHLGSGDTRIVLEDGHLLIDPLDLQFTGGRFEASFDTMPEGDMLSSRVTAKIDNADFGVVARRFRPETDMGGKLSLDVDLESNHRELVELLPNANGRFDFALNPENFKSGIIDMWASGVLLAIMPTFDSSNDSIINCVVARFDVTDGVMEHELIVADTSKIRIRGKGKIDLKKRKIDIDLRPVSKRPQFFSLATPVKLSGDLDDVDISIPPIGWLGTALRWSVAYIVVPIQILFGKRMPEDGSDVCSTPMQREP